MSTHISYEIVLTFDAPPERVWRAFTEPADLAAWVWGAGAADVRATVDLVPGGIFDISTDVTGKGWGVDRAGMRGIYAVIEPPRLLAHSIHWDSPVGYNEPGMDPLDEVIVVRLTPEGDGTLVRYLHAGIPDDGRSAPEHERSVRVTLNDLAKHLAAE